MCGRISGGLHGTLRKSVPIDQAAIGWAEARAREATDQTEATRDTAEAGSDRSSGDRMGGSKGPERLCKRRSFGLNGPDALFRTDERCYMVHDALERLPEAHWRRASGGVSRRKVLFEWFPKALCRSCKRRSEKSGEGAPGFMHLHAIGTRADALPAISRRSSGAGSMIHGYCVTACAEIQPPYRPPSSCRGGGYFFRVHFLCYIGGHILALSGGVFLICCG